MSEKVKVKKEPTQYQKDRTAFRAATPRHILVFETDMLDKDLAFCFRFSENERQLSNRVKGTMKKRLNQLFRTKEYRSLQKKIQEGKNTPG